MSDMAAPPQPVAGGRYKAFVTRCPKEPGRVQVQIIGEGATAYNAIVDLTEAWALIGKFGIAEVYGTNGVPK